MVPLRLLWEKDFWKGGKMKKQLLIGCGSMRDKRMTCDNNYEWDELTTLDYNDRHKPDMVWNLMWKDVLPPTWRNEFDEIHAYEVLEHLGQQGDYHRFFDQFSAFHRALKPGGHFLASVPSVKSPWAWGDPSHSRVITPEQLIFLDQASYEQVGKTSMSDFRNIYQVSFQTVLAEDNGETFHFILKAIK